MSGSRRLTGCISGYSPSVGRWRAVLPTVSRSSEVVPWPFFFSQDIQRLPSSNYRKSHEIVLGVLLLRLIAPVSCGRKDKVCICHKHTLCSPCIGKFLQFTHSFRDAFFPRGRAHPSHLLNFSLMPSRTEGRRGSPWGLEPYVSIAYSKDNGFEKKIWEGKLSRYFLWLSCM